MTETGDPGQAGQRRLELRVGIVGEPGLPEYLPVLKILADGQELLAGPHGSDADRCYPQPPGMLLGSDEPLLPARPPRRVVLYT